MAATDTSAAVWRMVFSSWSYLLLGCASYLFVRSSISLNRRVIFCSDARRAHLHCRDPAFMTMIPNAARKASPEKIISYRKHYRCGQTLIAQDISSGCVPVIMGSSTDSPCMSALCAHQGVTQCRVYFKTGRTRHSPHCPCFTDLSLLRLGCACALRTGISQDAP